MGCARVDGIKKGAGSEGVGEREERCRNADKQVGSKYDGALFDARVKSGEGLGDRGKHKQAKKRKKRFRNYSKH